MSSGKDRQNEREDQFEDDFEDEREDSPHNSSTSSSSDHEDEQDSSHSDDDASHRKRNRNRGRNRDRDGDRSDRDTTLNLVTNQESTTTPGTYEARATTARDQLTGQPEAPTHFIWDQLKDSVLQRDSKAWFDQVINFSAEDHDRLIAPSSVSTQPITQLSGRIRTLTPGQINAKALSKATFAPNAAAAFTSKEHSGIFVAFNDSRAGYQHRSDTLIWLKDYDLNNGLSGLFGDSSSPSDPL